MMGTPKNNTQEEIHMSELNKLLAIFGYSVDKYKGVITKSGLPDNRLEMPDNIDGYPIKELAGGLFASSNIKQVRLPSGLEKIGNCAFQGNKLEEVFVPYSTEHIGYLAFADNPLSKIVLSPNIKFIDEYAFSDTNDNLVLVCQFDSYAHKFAISHGYDVEVLTYREMEKTYNDRGY